MQLLSPNQIESLPQSLHSTLEDIVNKIGIQSRFCISHPDYKPLELPTESLSRFQQLPSDIQNKYLNLQLSRFLYGIYYNGSLKSALAVDDDSSDVNIQNLENNTYLGVDVGFYDLLHENNKGEGYFSPDWLILKEELDGTLAVHKGGLTLHVEPEKHLESSAQTVTVGESIAIKMPKNLVQNGFYMAVSNSGSYTGTEIVRIYFNLTSEGAIALMNSLTSSLNAISIPFNFKTLYNPSDYGRYDSAVLYFDKSYYQTVYPVLEKVYAQNQAYFQPEVPLFTKYLAPGLGLAEEPNCKFAEKESFGMNRCQIVANALLDAWEQGNDSPESRMSSILQHFDSLEVELQRPYLNANSQDIYTALTL
jgi:hypothetical protein